MNKIWDHVKKSEGYIVYPLTDLLIALPKFDILAAMEEKNPPPFFGSVESISQNPSERESLIFEKKGIRILD